MQSAFVGSTALFRAFEAALEMRERFQQERSPRLAKAGRVGFRIYNLAAGHTTMRSVSIEEHPHATAGGVDDDTHVVRTLVRTAAVVRVSIGR